MMLNEMLGIKYPIIQGGMQQVNLQLLFQMQEDLAL